MLDVFNQDMFSVVSLTEAMNLLPYVPGRIGSMGLFTPKPVTTTTVLIEERNGRLSLLQTSPRGTPGQTNQRARRKARTFQVPHIQQNDAVIADEVQGVRAFGEEASVEVFASIVNEKLEEMRQDHEVTNEYHRAGAVRGEVLDADGSLLFDLFDAFGITEEVFPFAANFAADENDGELKQLCLNVKRHIRDQLGADSFATIHAFCGDAFFDALIKHKEVRDSYKRWREGEYFRTQQGGKDAVGFTWGEITWENYRGKVGDRDFIEADEARFFPTGVPRLFRTYYAPADYIETVNTLGRPFYAKREPMKFGRGIELETQTNPLHICTRPSVLCSARSE